MWRIRSSSYSDRSFRCRIKQVFLKCDICLSDTFKDRQFHMYAVKKAFRYSRPRPGCHLPNSPLAGIMMLHISYVDAKGGIVEKIRREISPLYHLKFLLLSQQKINFAARLVVRAFYGEAHRMTSCGQYQHFHRRNHNKTLIFIIMKVYEFKFHFMLAKRTILYKPKRGSKAFKVNSDLISYLMVRGTQLHSSFLICVPSADSEADNFLTLWPWI